MALDQARAFVAKLKEDRDLQQQVGALDVEDRDDTLASLVALGNASGYSFTAQEISQVWDEQEEFQSELDEKELNSVTGGGWFCFTTQLTTECSLTGCNCEGKGG